MFKKLILTLLACLLFAGCASENRLSPRELVDDISRQLSITGLADIAGEKLSGYFSFSDKDVKQYSVKIAATGEISDIIGVFEYSSLENKAKIIDGLSKYLAGVSSSFKNTMEQESKKLQNRVLDELDNMIILVVCTDFEGASDYLADLGAAPIK